MKNRPLLSALALAALLAAAPLSARTRIIVEAAHGGSDTGCRSSHGDEKDWNLKFAKALKAALEASDVEAVLLREKDETIQADKRFELLNTSRAAAAVIVHVDREAGGQVRGPFFVVQPPQTNLAEAGLPEAGTVPLGRFKQSLRLARAMASALKVSDRFSTLSEPRATAGEKTSADGRILAAPHQSLRYAALPAVVVEPFFLSQEDDAKTFASDQAVKDFAASVAGAVAEAVKEWAKP